MKSEQQKLSEQQAANKTNGDMGTNLLLTSQNSSTAAGGDIWNNAFSPVPQRRMDSFPAGQAMPAQPAFGQQPGGFQAQP